MDEHLKGIMDRQPIAHPTIDPRSTLKEDIQILLQQMATAAQAVRVEIKLMEATASMIAFRYATEQSAQSTPAEATPEPSKLTPTP